MKRETPRFSPSALKPAPPAKLRLCFPDCRPPAPQQDNRTDGRTDRARARRRGAGREGRGALGVSAGCPLPAARPGPLWGFFSFRVPPRPLSPGAAPAGRTDGRTAMGAAAARTAPGSGSGASGARRRHRPQPCAPRPSRRRSRAEQSGAEEMEMEMEMMESRGGAAPRGPRPAAPASPPAPPRPWRRRRVLSLLPARSRGTL